MPYLIIIFYLCIVDASADYFPTETWESSSPSKVGANKTMLTKAIDFAKNNEHWSDRALTDSIKKHFSREPFHEILGPIKARGGPAGMIIKNGYCIAQWGDVTRVDMTFSVSKNYLATIAGLASDNKLIHLDQLVNNSIDDEAYSDSHNAHITWHHLLNQSSDWSGTLFGLHDWADRPPLHGTIEDWKNRTLHKPGTVFEYNDVRVNLLAYSLLKLWQQPLNEVLKEKIMAPIGVSDTWQWHGYKNSYVDINGQLIQSVSGGGHSGGGMFINTLDQARFGLLIARNGRWQDQQLISKEWIQKSIQPSAANKSYGYMWWLNRGSIKWDKVEDESIFYAAGFGGNFIIIDQSNDLVIVTRWVDASKIGEFVARVYAALES